MKKTFLLSFIIVLFSCSQSLEEKAVKLIKDSESEISTITIEQPPFLEKVVNKELNDVVGYTMSYTEKLKSTGIETHWIATFNKNVTEITNIEVYIPIEPVILEPINLDVPRSNK